MKVAEGLPSGPALARRLALGSGMYGATSLGVKALGFALLCICSRFLSPRDFGVVSVAESVGIFVGAVGGLGLAGASRRLYFQFASDPDELRSYVGNVLRVSFVSAGLLLAVAMLLGPGLLSRVAPSFDVAFFPYLALAIATSVAAFVLQCRLMVYQCEERIRPYVGYVSLQALAAAVLTLAFVVWARHGAAGLLSARMLGTAVPLALVVLLSQPLLRARWRWNHVRETLRVSVGVYSLAYQMGMVMPLVTDAVSRAWSPMFFSVQREGEAGRKAAAKIFGDLVLALAAIACVGALFANTFVRWFIDVRYASAGRIVPIVLGAYLCHSFFVLFQLSAVQVRRTEFVLAVSAVALAVNIALNFVLVPSHGMYGAAWATLAAYFVEMALMAAVAQRLLPMPYGWLRPLAALAGFAIVLAFTQGGRGV